MNYQVTKEYMVRVDGDWQILTVCKQGAYFITEDHPVLRMYFKQITKEEALKILKS